MSTKQGVKNLMIDINKLTTKKGNINSGILAVADKQDRFVITDIDIDDLIPSEDNFYSLTDIESLKDNVEEFGLQQNLTVMRRPDKKYEIISGHRRHEACRLLVKEGKKKFSWLPCRIIPTMSDTVKNILLITMNSETRKKTSAEITEEIERLKILYTDYKKENPEFKGRIRETIAENMGMSVANVGRHEKISKNLIPEVKEAYKGNDINFAAANELSGLSAEDQKAVYEETGGKVTVKDVKQYQQEIKQPQEPENLNVDGFETVPKKENNQDNIQREYLAIPKKYKVKVRIDIEKQENKTYASGFSFNFTSGTYHGGSSPIGGSYETIDIAKQAAVDGVSRRDENLAEILLKYGYIKQLPEAEQSEEKFSYRWYAIKTTMAILDKQIEKVEAEDNAEGADFRAALAQYLKELKERAQKECFQLSEGEAE